MTPVISAKLLRFTPLIEFYGMLIRHLDGVVAWARHRMTNAALEGNRSRVRAISNERTATAIPIT